MSMMSILEEILMVNVILKFFNLIDWSWSLTFWPLWTELIILAILYFSGNLDEI